MKKIVAKIFGVNQECTIVETLAYSQLKVNVRGNIVVIEEIDIVAQ